MDSGEYLEAISTHDKEMIEVVKNIQAIGNKLCEIKNELYKKGGTRVALDLNRALVNVVNSLKHINKMYFPHNQPTKKES